jgi:hypothetical protein
VPIVSRSSALAETPCIVVYYDDHRPHKRLHLEYQPARSDASSVEPHSGRNPGRPRP